MPSPASGGFELEEVPGKPPYPQFLRRTTDQCHSNAIPPLGRTVLISWHQIHSISCLLGVLPFQIVLIVWVPFLMWCLVWPCSLRRPWLRPVLIPTMFCYAATSTFHGSLTAALLWAVGQQASPLKILPLLLASREEWGFAGHLREAA